MSAAEDDQTQDSSASPSAADLMAVLDVARGLAASPELQPLLEQVEAAALRVLDCDRAGVFVHDEKTNELVGRAVTGEPGLRFPADRGIAGAVFRDGHPIRLADAHVDPRFNPEVDRKTGYRTRSLLTVPIRGWDERPIGVLNALNSRSGPFDARDEALATALAVQVGVAIQRQLLFDQAEERRRFERDLDVAKRIQQGLMPRRPPKVAGYDLAGWNLPADETGGDFFDLQALDDGPVALTVADVAGHGIGPALLVAECRAFIRATVTQLQDPARLVERVDLLLSEDLPEDRFITLFFGLLHPLDGRVRYTSAGHGPNLVYRASTGIVEELPPHGCPLGVAPELTRAESTDVPLAPGDILAVFTDGFTEWANPDNVQFGENRVGAALARHRELPANQLINAIYQDLLTHTAGSVQPDDVTAVVVKRL
ncbi:PP2C family protein-serine/threonine phosphatase [Tundrisphaera lichenicola]|uniref:PP2C family protein-serine/threonine phosphatase n=1 Tax=Tundrisphaera lichenicola TaxID=2029860 RepID=UPI003EB91913